MCFVEEKKKIERMELDYDFEDNDASYSAFGWDFQVNAGIFLFLRYIKEADSIVIESKYQDIELSLKTKKIYAQAKSLQSESGTRNENAKLRDALVSLAKVKTEEQDLLIYISNLSAPIDNEKDKYRNTVVPFTSCSIEHQNFIKNQIQTVIDRLEKSNKDPEISGAKKAKNELLIGRLETFNYDQLSIASIYPFEGDNEEDRYKKVKEQTIALLTNTLNFESYEAVGYVDKIIKHWQQVLAFNATIADNKNQRKYISKKDFLWTVIAVSAGQKYVEFIEDSLSQSIDGDIEDQCQRYLNDDKNVYHERFEFLNRVLTAYRDFKAPKNTKKDEAFIRSDSWKDFISEFADVKDDLLREYIIKSYMYRIINRHRQKSLFDSVNIKVLNNLLGIMYVDQDKGWTLLNRGSVIGRIKFDIEELIAGLAGIDCDELLEKKRALERNKSKYEAIIDINRLKEEVYSNNGEIFISDVEKSLTSELSLIDLQIRDLKEKIKTLDDAIEKEDDFWRFIDSMDLQVIHNQETISVNRENVLHSSDSIEYLRARRNLLLTDLKILADKKVNTSNKLQKYYETNTALTALWGNVDTEETILDRQLTTFSFDQSVVEKLLEKTKYDLRMVRSGIKNMLRKDNAYVDRIYRYVLRYAQILKIDDKVDPTNDYIFTEDLKSVSGANLQKLVFAFKVAFLKVIEESLGVKMIMVLDSPRGRELDNENLKLIMKIVREDLNENQVFVASIYDDFQHDVKITLKQRAIETRN